MTIDWMAFTPWMSFLGGVLIGGAALFLMITKGRVMGASGILSGLLAPAGGREIAWRLAFVVGTLLGPVLLVAWTGVPIAFTAVAEGWQLYLAALLVGIGAAISSGCTSGHGICGLSRLSLRSMAAVGTFMVTAIATVFIIRHLF